MAKKELTCEQAKEKLDGIVEKLSSGNLPIDQMVKLYEEGVKLAAKCAAELEDAKRKIKILQQGKDGEIELVDMPVGDSNN